MDEQQHVEATETDWKVLAYYVQELIGNWWEVDIVKSK